MASAALVDKAGMEDLQRVSSSRGCRAVSEKEAGLFLRKRYQRAGGGGGRGEEEWEVLKGSWVLDRGSPV